MRGCVRVCEGVRVCEDLPHRHQPLACRIPEHLLIQPIFVPLEDREVTPIDDVHFVPSVALFYDSVTRVDRSEVHVLKHLGVTVVGDLSGGDSGRGFEWG